MHNCGSMESVVRLTACLHCGKTVANEPAAFAADFCCTGCEFVYSLLNKQGLSNYYRLRETKPQQVSQSQDSFAYCDDPEFIKALSGDGRTLDFFLEGVDCTACVWLLEKFPEICEDAEEARLRMGTSRLRVRRRETGSFARIAHELDQMGYRPHPVPTETAAARAQQAADRKDLIRLGIAGFATGNIMLLAVSLYGGADGQWAERFRWLTGFLALPVLTYAAGPFYKNAWTALRQARLNIDVPIMLAVVVGFGVSLHGLWSGAETLYFDSLSMLVFLLLASRTWLKRLRRAYLEANDLDQKLLAGSVRKRQIDGTWLEVSALSVQAEDIIEVSEGHLIPTDGIATSGGLVQTAALTGESAAQRIITGDVVEAGSKVVQNRIALRATRSFGESRLSEILRKAELDARSKPRWIQFADRVAQAFILVVLAIAAATFLTFIGSDPAEGARRALALIIVTCPCVFGMAIPLSLCLSIKAAAKKGIVIKNADLVERLAGIKTVVLDKTGTLTEGDLRVVRATKLDDSEAISAALALEEFQSHPVARAIREFLTPKSLVKGLAARNVHTLADGGIAGEFAGTNWRIVPVFAPDSNEAIRARLQLMNNENVRMEFEIEDRLKPQARETVRWFLDQDFDVRILSGDHPSTVAMCAKQLGLVSKSDRASGGVMPEWKASTVRELGEGTLMIGDGANDAAALAAATAGIAVHGAMDVSLSVSDAYIMGSDLGSIPKLFEIARLTRRAIRRNLVFSAAFNVFAGSFAVAGLMTPLWAAVLMPLSSVTVLLSALSTFREKENRP